MSDQSSTESDEMTAENQNQHNLETDSINNILGNFMETKEETFEELVSGFLYLTMDDVQNSTCLSVSVNQNTNPSARGGDQEIAEISEERVVVLGNLASDAACNASGNHGESEDIEEEILQDDGASRQTSENALFRHRPASLTKFDNFVIAEDDFADDTDKRPGKEDTGGDDKGVSDGGDDEDNDWLPSSGYMASFAAGDAATEQSTADSMEQATSQISSQPNTEAAKSSDRPQQNPAAISCIIKPTSTTSATSATSTPHGTASDTSDSECDEFSTACDAGLKVAPLSSDHGPTSETSNFEGDEFSTECEAESKISVWTMNPGEVEEEEVGTVPVTQGINMMEFTMKVVAVADGTDNVKVSAAGDTEDCGDDVVPFSLDEDFDYDNVAYTPKFTREEMAYLTSFVPQNS